MDRIQNIKVQFDMGSLLKPYTFLGENSGTKPDEEPAFNLATGEVVEMRPGDPAKEVGLTVYASDKPEDMGMLFVRDIPVGSQSYLEYLRGILDERERQQLGNLARLNLAHDNDSYRTGGNRSRVTAETEELTRLSSIPPTDRNINTDKLLGMLAATASDPNNPLAMRAAGALAFVADLTDR